MKDMILASTSGFLPTNSGEENRRALQKMFDVGGHILIDKAGKYDLCGTAYIGSDTTIKGMTLECGGVDITREHENIVGAHAHVVFFYTKHTKIENFTCLDLEPHGFCIQICTFEDSLVENVHIEGMKDTVHYGPGRDFVLRNGIFQD